MPEIQTPEDQHQSADLTLLFLHELIYIFSQLGYVYVFKDKSGCNLCCLSESVSPVRESEGEGPIPGGDFNEDRASSHPPGLESFVLSHR